MFALILCALVITSIAECRPNLSPENVKYYETVHLQVLDKIESTENLKEHPESLTVQIATKSGETFTLQLTLNDKLISPNFKSAYYEEDGTKVETTDFLNCYYQGYVREYPGWRVAVDTCQGLRGSFGDWSNRELTYNVEPLSLEDYSLEQPHVLFLRDESDGQVGILCGTKGSIGRHLVLDEEHLDRVSRQNETSPLYVELFVINDNAQYLYYDSSLSRTVSQALSIVNAADQLYETFNIDFAVTLMETWTIEDTLPQTDDSDTAIYYVYVYSSLMRTYLDELFDVMIHITAHPYDGGVLGVAPLGGMCNEDLSITAIQDPHYSLALTGTILAHEAGHLFNMDHDDASCDCDEAYCIMWPSLMDEDNPADNWSSCSTNAIQSALSRETDNLGRCLTNNPHPITCDPACQNAIRKEVDNLQESLGSFTCLTGYHIVLDEDRITCLDINECREGTHNCEQVCNNNSGSFTCSCNDGYPLEADGHSCN